MVELSPDDAQLLKDARAKAEKLLADLLAQQLDLEQNAPNIPAGQLAAGKAAFENAIKSARRMLDALNEAASLTIPSPARGD